MSIERLLQRPGVKKVIDPDTGGQFLDKIKESQGIPTSEERTAVTPIPVIVQDLILRATTVETKTKAVIAEIKEANYSDHTFKTYYDLVASVQVSIDEVLKNPSKDLTTDKQQQEIKALERSVYLNSGDPRASFIQTLFDTLQQTGVIRMLASTIWQGISVKTDLYDEFSDDPIARYAIWRTNSELNNMLGLVTGVQGLRAPDYTGVLSDALSELIIGRSGHLVSRRGGFNDTDFNPELGTPAFNESELIESWNGISVSDVIDDLEDLAGKFKKLHMVLDLRKLDLVEHWEKLGENLKSTFQTVYRQFVSEALGTLFFSLTGQVTDHLLDFVDALPVLNAAIHNPTVFSELIRQTELGLLKIYQDIEGHVLAKEQRTIEHRDISGAMIGNAMAAASVGANIGALASAAAQISAIQQKLKAVGGSTTIDIDSLKTYLRV